MPISNRNSKILWANAAGRCSFTECNERLCMQGSEETDFLIGEMAHICGERPAANRYNSNQTDDERNHYNNLILLCPNHHTLVDEPDNEVTYSELVLKQMKTVHEGHISNLLDQGAIQTKYDLARKLHPLLQQNYQVFINYGPHSDIARRNPHNDSVHAVWITERLAIIVPNNRKIVRYLEAFEQMFNTEEQDVISRLKLHVSFYERWVRDEISYESVLRFPTDFETMIRGLANASA